MRESVIAAARQVRRGCRAHRSGRTRKRGRTNGYRRIVRARRLANVAVRRTPMPPKAADPRIVALSARKASCASPSPTQRPPEPARPGRGRVSNYAWSDDYHRRMRALLGTLAHELRSARRDDGDRVRHGTGGRTCAFAERAGVGWIGKHTNLIAPGLGSYVFLGEVVTSLALTPDAPLKKTVRRVRALRDRLPHRRIARRLHDRCHALHFRSHPAHRADSARNAPADRHVRLWGCDILRQDACPPNESRAARNRRCVFAPVDDAETRAPALAALPLRLAQELGEFKRRYARTAIGWRGAAILQAQRRGRHGQHARPRGRARARGSASPAIRTRLVRRHAAWALGRIGSPRALAALRARLDVEPDELVLDEIRAALLSFSQAIRVG